jgi:hypothetical protein
VPWKGRADHVDEGVFVMAQLPPQVTRPRASARWQWGVLVASIAVSSALLVGAGSQSRGEEPQISLPTSFPTSYPTDFPTSFPSGFPTSFPTDFPTSFPTDLPTSFPSGFPTSIPTDLPTAVPSQTPSYIYPSVETSRSAYESGASGWLVALVIVLGLLLLAVIGLTTAVVLKKRHPHRTDGEDNPRD